MSETNNKSNLGEISASLNKLGNGISDAARDLNPVHPQSSLQVSLLIAAVVVGFCAYLYAQVISFTQQAYDFYFQGHPYLTAALGPLFFLLAAWLVVRFAPEAKGSGIPQVLQAIDQTSREPETPLTSPLVSIKTAAWKVLSSLVGILGGASIGREGPTVQISSSLFAFTSRYARKYFGDVDLQSYLVAGASAGIAAAFNTPLAGITFALEEIAENSFGHFKRTVMLAVIVGGITAQAIGGNYLYFGHPTVLAPQLGIIPMAVGLGLLGGTLGGLFARSISKTRWTLLPTSSWWARALFCGVVCSLFGLLSNGDTAGSGYEVTKRFMDNPHGALPPLLFIEKLLCTIFSYLSGMAGGIFSPCLSIGAGMGFTFGQLFHFSGLKACALLGMVAFFSGAVQAPLTAVVIVMEMTDQSALLIPFMIAAFLAQGIGRLIMPTPLYRYLAFRGKDPNKAGG